jgi:prefoldin subunit 5
MTDRETKTVSVDPNALVEEVLREAYLQCTEDLRRYAEKVQYYNEQKKALRAYLAALRQFKANLISAACKAGVDLCRGDKRDLAVLAKLFHRFAHAYEVGETEHGLCIPARVPLAGVDTLALLDATIARWEERLASMGDDAQLATIDLQNVLQKQQQILQMMSNVSKMVHEVTMAIIRRMGG